MNGNRLPSAPHVLDGDSLSGFVVRVAHLYGISMQRALLECGWPPRDGQWQSPAPQLDVLAPTPAIARTLSTRTGVSPMTLPRMVLERYHRTAADFTQISDLREPTAMARHPSGKSAFRWLYATASPICPRCLVERPGAHQLAWRVAYLPVCLTHSVTLVSHCPACDRMPRIHARGMASTQHLITLRCRCRARLDQAGSRGGQVTPAQIKAAQTVASWLEGQSTDAATAIADLRVWIHRLSLADPAVWTDPDTCLDPQVSRDLRRRHADGGAGRRGANGPPGAALTAAVLPMAVSRVLAGLAGEPDSDIVALLGRNPLGEIHRRALAKRSARQAAAAYPAQRRGGSWRRLAPELRRPPDLLPGHLPSLLPLDVFAPRLADIVADAGAVTGYPGRPLGLTPARRAASVALACGWWKQSLTQSIQQLGCSPSALHDIRRIHHRLQVLDRANEWWHALISAAEMYVHQPRIDYAARAAVVRLPGNPALDRVVAAGLPVPAARAWLIEHYACLEPERVGSTWHECRRADLPAYLHLLDEDAVMQRLDATVLPAVA